MPYSPVGEQNKYNFVKVFGAVLKRRNVLLSFDEFAGKDLLTERDLQDYLGIYQDIKDEVRGGAGLNILTNINDDMVFETDLISQLSVNLDHILAMVEKYNQQHQQDHELLVDIQLAMASSQNLRSKKELIDTFIRNVITPTDALVDWNKFIIEAREKELQKIIAEESLDDTETRKFLDASFRAQEMKETGESLDKLLPKMSRFAANNRSEVKQRVYQKLQSFFNTFSDTGISELFYKIPSTQERSQSLCLD